MAPRTPMKKAAPRCSPVGGREIAEAAFALALIANVTLGDMHLDARLYPQRHPYGTGSVYSVDDKCKMSEYIQNHVLSLQHDFRRPPVRSFQFLDRIIKNNLYFRNQSKRRGNAAVATLAPTATPAAGHICASGVRKR